MNLQEELTHLWTQDYIDSLPNFVKDRGFVYCENNYSKEILLTGINPSYRAEDPQQSFGYDFQKSINQEKWDVYWGPLKRMLFDDNGTVDLRNRSAYLDIFYFREKDQTQLRKSILKSVVGVKFLVDQLRVTQHIIENIITPKLIIIKNRESAYYWGKYATDGYIWMGYDFNFLKSTSFGELHEITGLIDPSERIAPDIRETALIGTKVLFTHHISQYTKREKRPSPQFINDLL